MPEKLQEAGGQMVEDYKDFHLKALYNSIGFTLSTWAKMEVVLVSIAALLLEVPQAKAGVIMYSIVNFNVWLSVIGELVSLDPRFAPLKPKWNKISEKLRGLKGNRDRLAHHTVTYMEDPKSAYRPVLEPAELDLRQKSLKYQPLTVETISIFNHDIAEIIHRLADFIGLMTAAALEHRSSLKI